MLYDAFRIRGGKTPTLSVAYSSHSANVLSPSIYYLLPCLSQHPSQKAEQEMSRQGTEQNQIRNLNTGLGTGLGSMVKCPLTEPNEIIS